MRKILRVVPFVLFAFILAFTPLVAAKKTRATDEFPVKTQEYKGILTVWNIDCFEGGAGSRTDFLSRRASEYGKDGLLIMVKSHTLESARKSMESGDVPSMISYGVGADFVGKFVKKIKFSKMKFSDEYFVPWCRGGYYLLRKQGDNRPIQKLCVSDGENNLSLGALYFSSISFEETVVKSPENAFYELLSGRADALIGTQRDLRRAEVRKAALTATPMETYSDLFQYISITTSDEKAYEYCVGFIEYLLGDETQGKIENLCMMPFSDNVRVYSALADYDFEKTEKSLGPFTPRETVDGFREELIECVKARKKCSAFENALKGTPKRL